MKEDGGPLARIEAQLRDLRSRTLPSDPQWKYVSVRRLLASIMRSIDEGLQWVVFEPNDEATWSRVHEIVADYLRGLWRDGLLMGGQADEAFSVRCDRTTMTQADIDAGQLVCVVGVAPTKPAEFVILRFSVKTAAAGA
jgi:uncharacterized protein